MKSNLKVLLVDDFLMMRTMMKRELIELGHTRITEANNGALALQILKEAAGKSEPFDLIFSDINMPEMNGFQLLQAIRSDEQLKGTPFIVISAECEAENIDKALKEGASEYIVKPITPEGIQTKLAKIFK